MAAALVELEAVTAQAIREAVPAVALKRWSSVVEATRADGQHCQSWLWSAPAKHSTRQISEVLACVGCKAMLYAPQRPQDPQKAMPQNLLNA
ncbi:MAG: hypothetical protein M3Z29_16370 [Pseudomonadota bacterium]|nr:hypothetical protein [Pseudomonadota bacterium]